MGELLRVLRGQFAARDKLCGSSASGSFAGVIAVVENPPLAPPRRGIQRGRLAATSTKETLRQAQGDGEERQVLQAV
jgi:hypothetical protein